MPNPNDRLATEAELIAYDSGLVDGRIEERQRMYDLLAHLRKQAQEKNLSQTANINAIIAILKGTKNAKDR
jgi:hypothetical protein